MNTNYRFNRNQLMALCTVILLAPALRLFPSGATELAGRAAWLSAPAAIPLLLIYIWLICKFMSARQEGEGLSELTLRCLGAKAGPAALLILSLWLLLYGGFVLRSGADRFITTIYPYSAPAVFTVSMGVLSLIAALCSARALVRMAKMVQPLLLGALLLIIIFALFSVDASNLLPVTAADIGPIFAGSLAVVDIVSVVIYLACFFGGMTPKEPKRFRDYSIWLLLIALLLMALNIAIVGNLGAELTTRLTRPFFSLVRNLVFFNSLERMEALAVALWVFPDFLLVSLLMYSAQHSLRLLFKADTAYRGQAIFDMGEKRWLIPLCGAATILCGILIAPDPVSLEFWSEKLIPLINLSFAFVVIPLIFLTGKLRKAI